MSERPVESIEIERKYEVVAGAELPDAATLEAAGFFPDAPVSFELHATYFDTAQGDLARHRLAVRRRQGGPDAGWHLKHKNPLGAHEFHWPNADTMPEGLRSEIAKRLGAEAAGAGPEHAGPEITPLAELRTLRSVVLLRDAQGRPTVELVDDFVRALNHRDGTRRAWREWEAELAPDAPESLFSALEPVLVAAGARPSPSPAKIARATGALVPLALAAGADEATLTALRKLDAADRAAAELD